MLNRLYPPSSGVSHFENKPFGQKEYVELCSIAKTNAQQKVHEKWNAGAEETSTGQTLASEKGIILNHKSALLVTTRTKDTVKGKSVDARLHNLEVFLRE
jgi:hypothetical protein